MRTVILLVILVVVGFVGWSAYTQPPDGFTVSNARDPQSPLVVKIHADFCPTCIDLGPTWRALETRSGSGARLVVLDVTNEERFDRTVHIARYLGLTGFLKQNMEATGTIAVLDGETREPVAVFHGERNLAAYLAAIDRARHT